MEIEDDVVYFNNCILQTIRESKEKIKIVFNLYKFLFYETEIQDKLSEDEYKILLESLEPFREGLLEITINSPEGSTYNSNNEIDVKSICREILECVNELYENQRNILNVFTKNCKDSSEDLNPSKKHIIFFLDEILKLKNSSTYQMENDVNVRGTISSEITNNELVTFEKNKMIKEEIIEKENLFESLQKELIRKELQYNSAINKLIKENNGKIHEIIVESEQIIEEHQTKLDNLKLEYENIIELNAFKDKEIEEKILNAVQNLKDKMKKYNSKIIDLAQEYFQLKSELNEKYDELHELNEICESIGIEIDDLEMKMMPDRKIVDFVKNRATRVIQNIWREYSNRKKQLQQKKMKKKSKNENNKKKNQKK